MKVILLSIICLGLHVGVNSQSYHPFPQSPSVWHAVASCYPDQPEEEERELYSHQYLMQGDTVIEGENWHKIYFQNQYLGVRSELNYLAAIRENEDRQILARFPESAGFVLYDFSLEVGDTIHYDIMASSYVQSTTPLHFWEEEEAHYKVVVEKDSVLLENGQYRNRLVLDSFLKNYGNLHIPGTWIEGLGCTSWSGLFHPVTVMRHDNGDHIHFACFMQDDIVLYLDNLYCEDCLCETFSWIPSHDQSPVTIFPNPTQGLLTIRMHQDHPANYNLHITDISGKSIYQQKAHNQHTIKVDLSPHPTGIYIIQITDCAGKILESQKILMK